MGSGTLSTVERAFQILDLLWKLDGAGPTEIAERMDVPDSTVYDYLRSLCETEFVTRQKGSYRLTHHFLTIGGKMRYRNRLFQVAKGEMKRLATETDELVGLTIENEGKALVFHQEEGGQALNLGTYLGASTPIHTTAGGKAILANLPDERVANIVENGLESRTENTITDPGRLYEELERIQEEGFALDWDQQVVGMAMVAVPVVTEDQIASMTVVSPTNRLEREAYQEELVQKLREAANTVMINYRYGR